LVEQKNVNTYVVKGKIPNRAFVNNTETMNSWVLFPYSADIWLGK